MKQAIFGWLKAILVFVFFLFIGTDIMETKFSAKVGLDSVIAQNWPDASPHYKEAMKIVWFIFFIGLGARVAADTKKAMDASAAIGNTGGR